MLLRLDSRCGVWLCFERSLFVVLSAITCGQATAQQPVGQQPAAAATLQESNAAPAATSSWIAYDRTTGRWYQQQAVPVNVPVVRWEYRPTTKMVYEVQHRVTKQSSQQTFFVPQSQTVMVPRVAGALNPFVRPTMSYQFKQVTTWVPRTVTVETPVVVPQVVAKQQTVNIPKPVQSTETQQQIVQREIAPPNVGMPLGAVAVNPQPLFPVAPRSRQMKLAYQPRMQASSLLAGRSLPPASGLPQPVPSQASNASSFNRVAASAGSTGLRPIMPPSNPLTRAFQQPYAAPLQPASVANVATRDELQSGMAATVLR